MSKTVPWVEIKNLIIQKMIKELELETDSALSASLSARESSTHGDAVAKSKYETQSTELSYLADGQAKRANTLLSQLKLLRQALKINHSTHEKIGLYSIVQLSSQQPNEYYFICPIAGGRKITLQTNSFQAISRNSPLAKSINGLYEDDDFDDFTVNFIR